MMRIRLIHFGFESGSPSRHRAGIRPDRTGVIVATIAIGFASLANALSNQFVSIGGSL